MKVIVTRPRAQAGPLVDRLEELGHEVVECPLIEIERTSDDPIDCAGYEWAVVTSPNGADEVARRARNLPKVAAVGPGTAETLRGHGIEPAFVPRVSYPSQSGQTCAALPYTCCSPGIFGHSSRSPNASSRRAARSVRVSARGELSHGARGDPEPR